MIKSTDLRSIVFSLGFFCHNICGYLKIAQVDITLHQFVNSNTESKKNDNSGLVIGIGTACFILGAALGGLVYFIITRNIRKTKLR